MRTPKPLPDILRAKRKLYLVIRDRFPTKYIFFCAPTVLEYGAIREFDRLHPRDGARCASGGAVSLPASVFVAAHGRPTCSGLLSIQGMQSIKELAPHMRVHLVGTAQVFTSSQRRSRRTGDALQVLLRTQVTSGVVESDMFDIPPDHLLDDEAYLESVWDFICTHTPPEGTGIVVSHHPWIPRLISGISAQMGCPLVWRENSIVPCGCAVVIPRGTSGCQPIGTITRSTHSTPFKLPC